MVIGIAGLMLQASRQNAASQEWVGQSWDFTKQIMPLLLGGVLIAGMLLGRPGHEGLIPSEWVVWAVGDNSFTSTLLASVLGAFMYFSTLPSWKVCWAQEWARARHWQSCWRGLRCRYRTCW